MTTASQPRPNSIHDFDVSFDVGHVVGHVYYHAGKGTWEWYLMPSQPGRNWHGSAPTKDKAIASIRRATPNA